jgi:DNA-binding XRE family transcriptional regulator
MVYFIQHTDFLKIGYTNDINKRLSELQVSCPIKLKVLGLIEGTRKEESEYHEKFKHLGSSGEWFNCTTELLEFTETLDKTLLWKHGFISDNALSPLGIIKLCRIKENMSLQDLGDLTGVTKQSIKEMELREIQGKTTLSSIINCLNAMGYKFEYRAIKKIVNLQADK